MFFLRDKNTAIANAIPRVPIIKILDKGEIMEIHKMELIMYFN